MFLSLRWSYQNERETGANVEAKSRIVYWHNLWNEWDLIYLHVWYACKVYLIHMVTTLLENMKNDNVSSECSLINCVTNLIWSNSVPILDKTVWPSALTVLRNDSLVTNLFDLLILFGWYQVAKLLLFLRVKVRSCIETQYRVILRQFIGISFEYMIL